MSDHEPPADAISSESSSDNNLSAETPACDSTVESNSEPVAVVEAAATESSASTATADQPATPAVEPAAKPRSSKLRRLAIILAIELPLLAVFVGAVWVEMTPDGQALWSSIWDGPKVEAEQQAAANLRLRGVLVISEPPDSRVTSVGFQGVTIDEEMLSLTEDLYRLLALNAAESKITDDQLRYFAGMSRLVSLVLAGTPVTDAGMAHLRSLNSVEALHLSGTAITDAGTSDIAQLGNLKVLDLSNTKITDAGLAPLTSLAELRWLLLSNTSIPDAGLEKLTSMKDLRRLSIGKTKATPAGIAKLKQALPELSVDQ